MFRTQHIHPDAEPLRAALEDIEKEVKGLDTSKLLFRSLPRFEVITNAKGLPEVAPSLFLLEKTLRSRSTTGDTTRTYGEAILKWMRYLEQHGLALGEASEESFGAYRSELANGQQELASTTVNLYVTVAVLLHFWGEKTGKMRSPFGDYLVERLENIQDSSSSRFSQRESLSPRVIERLPKFIIEEHRRLVMKEAKEPYRLMFKWASVVGMRRHEICNLRVQSLPKYNEVNDLSPQLVPLEILRKGGKLTTVYAPWKLIEETHWYVATVRPRPTKKYANHVFLNGRGNRIERGAVSREFRRCADLAGCAGTLHHLRHTYAVTLLHFLERARKDGDELNPLKVVQVLLGHSSIETTEIYLSAMVVGGLAVEQSLKYLYGDTDLDGFEVRPA